MALGDAILRALIICTLTATYAPSFRLLLTFLTHSALSSFVPTIALECSVSFFNVGLTAELIGSHGPSSMSHVALSSQRRAFLPGWAKSAYCSGKGSRHQ